MSQTANWQRSGRSNFWPPSRKPESKQSWPIGPRTNSWRQFRTNCALHWEPSSAGRGYWAQQPRIHGRWRARLEAIERNANAQAQLIEDILDLSSIISGKLSLNVQTVELPSIIRAAVDSVIPAAQSKSVRVRVNLAEDIGSLTGDPNRLQQIVWNLLSNAVKFTPSGGEVEVRLERVNSHVEITVSDSGQGISADFLPHVFEAFSQEDASTSRKHSGLGLGLSIVRQLVELHGGTIQVYSAGEGQGTTFKAKLPLAAPQC